jgi:hypothetical protein
MTRGVSTKQTTIRIRSNFHGIIVTFEADCQPVSLGMAQGRY